MAQHLREAVGAVVKRVAMDRRRLLGRKQASRLRAVSNASDLLSLVGLGHELIGKRIVGEAQATHKFQGNSGALVWSHLLVEALGVGSVEWRLHVVTPLWRQVSAREILSLAVLLRS
jgi:hypothetical protein